MPLLRTVHPSKYELGDVISRRYERPMYLPVRERYVPFIEINITDNMGRPVSFFPGERLVTLHFRRRGDES